MAVSDKGFDSNLPCMPVCIHTSRRAASLSHAQFFNHDNHCSCLLSFVLRWRPWNMHCHCLATVPCNLHNEKDYTRVEMYKRSCAQWRMSSRVDLVNKCPKYEKLFLVTCINLRWIFRGYECAVMCGKNSSTDETSSGVS